MQDSFKLLEKVRSYRPGSNPSVLQEFIQGSIHMDFCNEILARIEQMRDFNEDCKSNEYLETRGGIKALRLAMTIFDDLLANRINDLESEGESNEKDLQ